MAPLRIEFLTDPAHMHDMSEFFIANVSDEYISHGELMSGRAVDGQKWSPSLKKIIDLDFAMAAKNSGNQFTDGLHSAKAFNGDELVAIVLYEFITNDFTKYVILHDLVVHRQKRRQGIGNEVLVWFKDQAISAGVKRIFLESGINNHGAHIFFKNLGFNKCSSVMVCDSPAAP